MSREVCHCLCERWEHDPAVCTGRATTVVALEFLGRATPMPVCAECAAHIPLASRASNGAPAPEAA